MSNSTTVELLADSKVITEPGFIVNVKKNEYEVNDRLTGEKWIYKPRNF